MVDPYNIKQFVAIADPVHPESVILFLHMLPVIDRISPSLPCSTEIIRRYSGDEDRTSICIKKKVIFSTPYVYRILSHIERNISHNLDSGIVCSLLHLHPLCVENILKKHLILCLCLHLCR